MFINNHSNSLFNRLRGRALSNDSKDKRIFKLTVDHVARPNPMQICACAWIYRWKKLWKIRTGSPRAAGLLLAKPTEIVVKVFRKLGTHGVFLYTKLEGQGKLIVAVKDKFRVRQRV